MPFVLSIDPIRGVSNRPRLNLTLPISTLGRGINRNLQRFKTYLARPQNLKSQVKWRAYTEAWAICDLLFVRRTLESGNGQRFFAPLKSRLCVKRRYS